jgi:hypothetical protein
MIFDFRFLNFDWSAPRPTDGRLAACDDDRGELVGLSKQRLDSFSRQQSSVDSYLQPKTTLIGFLFDNTGFVHKVGARFCPAESAVIRSDRTSTPDKLICDGIATPALWDRVDQLKHTQGKFFSSLFHFLFVHSGL